MHPLDRQLNLLLLPLFKRAEESPPDSKECYKVLDEALQLLVQEAQKYRFRSRERQIVTAKLWEMMLPGVWDESLTPEQKRQRQKPTDDVARKRLGGVKSSLRAKYSNLNLNRSFDDCWDDAFHNTQKEFIKKIDIYQRGIDSILFDNWQKFNTNLTKLSPKDEITLSPVCQEFSQAVLAWQSRLEKRLRQRKDHNPDIEIKLTETCLIFCNAILPSALLGNPKLLDEWNNFCDEVKRYYRPKTVWNWFAMLLIYRFWDIIRRETRIHVESADAPLNADEPESGSKWDVITEQIPQGKKLHQEILQLIQDNPYEIFARKHIKNYPDITFRAIALFKNRQPAPNLTEIQAYFDNRVNAQTTISPFYTRCLRYFKPILEEFTSEETTLPLPPEVLQQIEADSDGKFQNKKISKDSPVTFHLAIQTRREVKSWKLAGAHLEVEVKDILAFYLDCLSEFKLLAPEKTRSRQNRTIIQSNLNLGDNQP